MVISYFKVICSLFSPKLFYPNAVYQDDSAMCIQKFITTI